jgi:hypothetical protein
MAYIGTSPSNGVRRRFVYEATASQTSFSGSDENGVTLTYVDSLYLDVFQNGIKLKAGDDYTATTGTTVVLVQGASANDVVEMVAFDIFSVGDTVSAKDGGNFAGNVGMGGTLDVTGDITLSNIAGGAVFNEGSADVDFRVESDNLTHALFVQGSDGNVGIGTSSPNSKLTSQTASDSDSQFPFAAQLNNARASNSSIVALGFHNRADVNATGVGAAIALLGGGTSGGSGNLIFSIKDATDIANVVDVADEKMRLNSAGRFLIGTTAHFYDGLQCILVNGSTHNGLVIKTTRSATGTNFMAFINSSGDSTGQINHNGTTSTNYTTSSDYRLKENVSYSFDATTRLKQLKPARFNFIAEADRTVDGFLAHEVSSIVPEAITGEKDAMRAEVLYVDGDDIPDGKKIGDVKEASRIDPQSIDQSKLVPLLVKTIQELEARITALENA